MYYYLHQIGLNELTKWIGGDTVCIALCVCEQQTCQSDSWSVKR